MSEVIDVSPSNLDSSLCFIQPSISYDVAGAVETRFIKAKWKMNQETYPDKNIHTYFHLIYDKRDKNIQWRKDSLFNKWCWEIWTVSCKRIKSEQSLTLHIKINSKWIKDLNVRLGTIKTLEKNIGRTLTDINRRKIFSKPLPRVMKINTKIKKM